jgi:hypothetical protein
VVVLVAVVVRKVMMFLILVYDSSRLCQWYASSVLSSCPSFPEAIRVFIRVWQTTPLTDVEDLCNFFRSLGLAK